MWIQFHSSTGGDPVSPAPCVGQVFFPLHVFVAIVKNQGSVAFDDLASESVFCPIDLPLCFNARLALSVVLQHNLRSSNDTYCKKIYFRSVLRTLYMNAVFISFPLPHQLLLSVPPTTHTHRENLLSPINVAFKSKVCLGLATWEWIPIRLASLQRTLSLPLSAAIGCLQLCI